MTETPFHHYGEDGARYEVDVILDRRDPADPHYDVDLVRSQTGRFGETVEQRLTLGEHPERDDAHAQQAEIEDTITRDGLDGLGDARERIAEAPPLYDGAYLTAIYPPDAEGGDRATAHLIAIGEDGVTSTQIADGKRDEVEQVTAQIDIVFAEDGIDAGLAAAEQEAERDRSQYIDGGGMSEAFNDSFTTERELAHAHWRMETLPVNDPDGEPLGHSMHMVVYDGVEHDPDIVGTPAIPEDEPFRMLEMAHFETTEAADKFGAEFNGYLMPGLLEGPELAEEVARLEGHPIEWKTLDGQELDDYRDLKLTLTRDPADWQPYNPNAERDARIEAEGLYTDPIHQFTTFDEEEDDPKVEPAAPDFDL